MKALKLFSLLIVTGFITMSMGFPVDIANGKNKQDKTPAHTNANKSTAMQAVKAEEPVQQLTMLLLSTTSSITVKVFDVKGALVMKEEVTMDEFLGKSKKDTLLTGSTFVMFHQNTAYFFLETGLIN